MIKYSKTFAGVRYVSEGDAVFPAKVEMAQVNSPVGTLGTYTCGEWKPTGVTVHNDDEVSSFEAGLM